MASSLNRREELIRKRTMNNEQSSSSEINLKNKSIERISSPNEMFNDAVRGDIVTIDLSFNRLTRIDASIFRDLFNLRFVYLNNNRLVELAADLFHELFELVSVNLSLNKLTILDTNLFFSNTNLAEVNLSFNRLSSVNVKLFKNCVNLRMLRLDGNRIEHIPSYAFETLVMLERLYLSYNQLEQLSKYLFKKCIRLKELYLNNNQLNELDATQFDYCVDLVKLDLSNNALSGIEPGTFDKCTKLKELGLFNNRFESLSSTLFRSLSSSSLQTLWLDTEQTGRFLSEFDPDTMSKVVARDMEKQKVVKYDMVEQFQEEKANTYRKSYEEMNHLRLSESFSERADRPMSLFRFGPPKYRTLDLIGRGTFGTVYLVKDLEDGKLKAIKIMDKNLTGKRDNLDLRNDDENNNNSSIGDDDQMMSVSSANRPMALNEIEILETLRTLNNEYIVKYYEFFFQENFICIVLEYCEKKDLSLMIQNQRKLQKSFPISLIFEWFRQIVEAICFLHANKIIHRDIKPDNVFVTNKRQLKLGDLGTAKSLECLSKMNTFVGTVCYMSPEILRGQSYNHKTDIWSAGCVLYEMRTLDRLFKKDSSLLNIVSNIVEYDIGSLIDKSIEIRALLESMLNRDPVNRVDSQDLLKRVNLLIQLSGN